MKGQTCTDSSKQRRYLKSEESVAYQTAAVESIISTFMTDAYEGRYVGVFDTPGAYLHGLGLFETMNKQLHAPCINDEYACNYLFAVKVE